MPPCPGVWVALSGPWLTLPEFTPFSSSTRMFSNGAGPVWQRSALTISGTGLAVLAIRWTTWAARPIDPSSRTSGTAGRSEVACLWVTSTPDNGCHLPAISQRL